MITTWQKFLIILLCAILGATVGYVVIKNNIEKVSVPIIVNNNVENVFNQYVENNQVNANNTVVE